ncbi:hypothetical protein LCGC14_2917390, partial [marine sediment metagenome]
AKSMHDIDFTKNAPAIAYTGGTPWHGYGQVMLPDQTLADWIIAAGLDYKVLERPVGWIAPFIEGVKTTLETLGKPAVYPKHVPIKGRKALIRDDVNICLSIVSDRYKPIQPKEIMQFFESLVKDEGFKMHTAGALMDGKRIWALAETGKEFALKGLDRIGAYLLLTTSYDGSSATTAQFTSIRVVCNNTLSFSLNRGENQTEGIVRVPHTTEFISADVKGQLGLTEGWVQFQDNVIQLADYKVSKRQAIEFFLELMGVTEDEAAEGKQLQNVKKLLSFYESAPGSQYMSSKNTTWGLVNAVSYFTDHGRRAQNNGTRFNSAAFGDGARLKKQAFSKALKMAA